MSGAEGGVRHRSGAAGNAMLLLAVLVLTFSQHFHEAFHEAAEHTATALCAAGTAGVETHWHASAVVLRGHPAGGDDFCPLCSGNFSATAANSSEFSVGFSGGADFYPFRQTPVPAETVRSDRARAPPLR